MCLRTHKKNNNVMKRERTEPIQKPKGVARAGKSWRREKELGKGGKTTTNWDGPGDEQQVLTDGRQRRLAGCRGRCEGNVPQHLSAEIVVGALRGAKVPLA